MMKDPRLVQAEIPLFKAYPSLAQSIPRVAILDAYTPLNPMSAFEGALHEAHGYPPPDAETGNRLWVKRDDRSTHELGGNKARKLEFLVAEAITAGKSSLVTSGRYGTNHGLATALAARAYGLNSRLILGPQPVTEDVKQKLLALHAAGATLDYHGTLLGMGWDLLGETLEAWLAPNDDEYYIPPGGSSPTGGIGYVNAFFELVEQVKAKGIPFPDEIIVPAGTGGTATGLLVGACLSGQWTKTKIVAVGVVSPLFLNGFTLRRQAKKLYRRLLSKMSAEDRARVPDACHFHTSKKAFDYISGYHGPGYGAAPAPVFETIALVREKEHFEIERTYTGKALQYAVDRIHAGLTAEKIAGHSIRPDASSIPRMLFWNTYNSHDLQPLIDAHAWQDAAQPWLDLPEKFWPLFQSRK